MAHRSAPPDLKPAALSALPSPRFQSDFVSHLPFPPAPEPPRTPPHKAFPRASAWLCRRLQQAGEVAEITAWKELEMGRQGKKYPEGGKGRKQKHQPSQQQRRQRHPTTQWQEHELFKSENKVQENDPIMWPKTNMYAHPFNYSNASQNRKKRRKLKISLYPPHPLPNFAMPLPLL